MNKYLYVDYAACTAFCQALCTALNVPSTDNATQANDKRLSTIDGFALQYAQHPRRCWTGSIRPRRRGTGGTMSIAPIGGSAFSGHDAPRPKITIASLREQKLRHEPVTCLTAYDYATARLVDEAGIEMVLVGDSLAQTILGYDNTLSVTMDEMLHHVKAVRRGVKHALLLADMPYGSYQVDPNDALRNATRFVKEGGAEVVKIEGGEKRADLIRQIVDAEIPVAGHIGLTPQSVNVMGGYKVQGKN